MAKQIDIPAAVSVLAQQIRDAADDAVEAHALLDLAMRALNVEYVKAAQGADEARAQLVLADRAVRTGVSVSDQLNAAGGVLKKRPEDVSASEALQVVLFASVDEVSVSPSHSPVTVAPAP